MPEITGTNIEKITGNQLFVAGDSYNSFDSRYTGLISSEKIIYTVEPLFTVKD